MQQVEAGKDVHSHSFVTAYNDIRTEYFIEKQYVITALAVLEKIINPQRARS